MSSTRKRTSVGGWHLVSRVPLWRGHTIEVEQCEGGHVRLALRDVRGLVTSIPLDVSELRQLEAALAEAHELLRGAS